MLRPRCYGSFCCPTGLPGRFNTQLCSSVGGCQLGRNVLPLHWCDPVRERTASISHLKEKQLLEALEKKGEEVGTGAVY